MINLCVLFGGVSSEHEVSLRSAASVIRNIDRAKYELRMLGITKGGRWLYYNGPVDLIESGGWELSPYTCPAALSPDRRYGGLLLERGEDSLKASQRIRRELFTDVDIQEGPRILPVDVVFPVLHGKNGEDGTVQGLLDLAGIPYVGSGTLASAACMDKAVTHALLEYNGIAKTKLIALKKQDLADMEALEARLAEELGYPMFVKPANAGSSVGITKVKSREDLAKAFGTAFAHDNKIVVEQMMQGKEIECAVMGNGDPVAAAVLGEIAPTNEFYDYAGKYLEDSTELHIPARIPAETVERVRETAVRAYKAMDCRGLARVDFFVGDNGEIVLNEINTLPGFTSISMYAKLFIASGVSYPELVDKLIGYALEKTKRGGKRMDNRPIGVFDSGVGGLTAVKELQKILPGEDIVYFGDTGRVPYGTRSKQIINKYASQDILYLMTYGVKAIVAACGTVSANLPDGEVKKLGVDVPYTGVIMPATRTACAVSTGGRIGVIATAAAIRTGAYGKAVRAVQPTAKVLGNAAPLLVPLVENGMTEMDNQITRLALEMYLEPLRREEIDTLILGCTHYPILYDIINDILEYKVPLVDPGAAAAREVQVMLTEKGLLADREQGETRYRVTDSVESFTAVARHFLHRDIDADIEHVDVDALPSLP